MKNALKVGDVVGYSKRFLLSTGQSTGTAPHGRGVIKAIKVFGNQGRAVVTVDWQGTLPDGPIKVLNCNLAKIGSIACVD